MRKKISKYFNIYVVTAFIGGFSLLYIFSYAFVFNDVTTGSSRDIKKAYCEKNPDECKVSLKGSSQGRQ